MRRNIGEESERGRDAPDGAVGDRLVLPVEILNWVAVWLSGEWLRLREGLSPFSKERLDLWLDAFFDAHILTGQGIYQEPGHPNSYDLFTRYHLADMPEKEPGHA